jgi:SAM-dependent methyltransferase
MSATPAASAFTALDPDAYDQLMGRWSRRLGPLLINFGGIADGERVLDVGCGTGSLTFALPEAAAIAAVEAVDFAAVYVARARARNTDRRITIREADARDLPFATGSFDRAYSQLVLHHMPQADRAVAEMRRVVRPGGTVTAAVWDSFGGSQNFRIMWDIAGVIDPDSAAPFTLLRPLTAPGEMAKAWREAGLVDVVQADLLIRMDFACFDDFWSPLLSGEGPAGKYVASLTEDRRATLTGLVRRAYLANRPDGLRSFPTVAIACRGTVPG